MSSQIVKLIVELENKAKAQLEQLTKAMAQVKQSADRATSAINKINAQAISNLERETREASTGMKQLSDSSRQTANQVRQINSNGVNQLSASFKQASTALNTASNSSRALTTTLQTTSTTARNAASSVNQINGNGPRQATSTAQMLRAILVVLIGIAGQVHQILLSFANNGLDDAAMDAQKLQSSLAGVSSAGNNAKAGMSGLSTSTRTTGSSFGFLSNAASMAAGMIGYDLVNSIAMSARESINASGNFQAFGERMGMTASEIDSFNQHCEGLQQSFRKVDMTAVGASALELGVKLKLPKESMEELTKTTAVMSSAFVKEGRTQTDAILAVSDAMDGQFRRLQELGISQEMLKNNGWDGDLQNKTGLLQAMNKTLDEMGFTETAQQINTLDEAYQALSVAGGDLLAAVLIPITPYVIQAVEAFLSFADSLKQTLPQVQEFAGSPLGQTLLLIAGGITAVVAGAVGLVKLHQGFLNLKQSIKDFKENLDDAIDAVKSIGTKIKNAFSPVTNAADKAGKKIKDTFKSAFDKVKDSASTAAGKIKDKFNNIDWNGIGGKIKTAFTNAFENVKTKANGLKTTLSGIGNKINFSAVTGKFNALKSTLMSVGATAKSTGLSLLTAGKNALTAGANAVISAGKWAIETAAKYASAAAQTLLNAVMSMNPITLIVLAIAGLIAVLVYLYQNCEPVREAINQLWEGLQQLAGWIYDGLITAWNALIEALQPVIEAFQNFYNTILVPLGEFLMNVFLTAWNNLVNTFMSIWNLVQTLINVFVGLLTGQISLQQGITMIWNAIKAFLVNAFGGILQNVISWASNFISNGINAASGFLNAVIQFIQQLPGKIYSFLMSVISFIVSAGGQWISNAKNKAKGVVDGVINFIKELPGKVYTEFMNIGKRILSAGSDLVNKAKQVGQDIVNGILGAMGIHSPGTIQESVVTEFENMFKRIKNTGRTAYDTAKRIGGKLVEGFSSEDVSSALSEATTMNADVTANISESTEQDSSNENPGLLVGSVVAEDNKEMETSFSSLTSSINMNGAAIQSRTSWITTSFANMRKGVTSALTSLENNNKSTWNDVEKTSSTTLENMNSDTLNVTNAMSNAWWVMRDNIVSAAADIKSKANSHFNSLSSNIGGFYRRIQNPSSWAGPSTSGSRTSSRGAVSSGAGRLRNIVSSAITPTFAGTAPIYKLADSVCKNETCKDFYLTKNNRLERFDIEEFYRRANNNFAGWGDWSPKHMSYIKKKTGEWNMKGPVINLVGEIPTGLAFKVKQFENGSKPSLGMESFQKVAEAIFSVIGYDYYWNSDKTGDPISALQTGSVNCWDGAHSLMALANVFGLSASLGRGTGHVWAVINGKTFDTTNYSKHRSWSPLPGYTGPRRRHSTQKEEDNVPEVIDLNINQNVDVHLKSDGNIEVDEATIIDTLKGVITDRTLVDKIAKALKQRDRRINRMSGA